MADFITEVRDRRILPAVGVYVASSWVVIEILDRLVERYLLSPYLTDIVFWGLYSLIPAVMLIAWTHGRKGKDKTTRVEKVGVPINLIATIGLLVTAFGDKDLDLAATQITVNNELGQQETHYIPSETFRRRMAVFFWENTSGDPELDWLQYGVTELLVQDLQQDPFVLANSPWNNFGDGFYSRMRQAGFNDGLDVPRALMRKIANEANRQYFVEGEVKKVVDDFVITARIWETQSVKQVAELTVSHWDVYTAVDRMSREVREALDIPEGSSRIAEDLPLADTYGESEEAFKSYIQGLNARLFENDFAASNAFFDEAVTIDPNFVLAWFLKAVNLVESGDVPAAQAALSRAQALDYRLSSNDKRQIKALVYRLAGDHEKLMSFLRLQAQVRDDANAHNVLATMLMYAGELEAAKSESLLALERDALNVGIYLRMSALERATGDMDAAVAYARTYQEHKPEDIEANLLLGDLLRDSGDFDASEKQYKQAQVLQNSPVQPTLRLALIAARKGDIKSARQYLTEAESYAQTPLNKTLVRQAVVELESRLGEIRKAISQTLIQEEFLSQSRAPMEVALSIYSPLAVFYIQLGDLDSARDALDSARAILQPPLDKFLSFAEALIHIKENDLEAARASLAKGEEIIEQFQLRVMDFQVQIVRARISEAQQDFAAVIDHYLLALDSIEHSVVAGQLSTAVPSIYAELARAQVKTADLGAAQRSVDAGLRLDPTEPQLWVVKAELQKAQDMPQLALASVNYALAIWKDADEDYVFAKKARSMAEELQDN